MSNKTGANAPTLKLGIPFSSIKVEVEGKATSMIYQGRESKVLVQVKDLRTKGNSKVREITLEIGAQKLRGTIALTKGTIKVFGLMLTAEEAGTFDVKIECDGCTNHAQFVVKETKVQTDETKETDVTKHVQVKMKEVGTILVDGFRQIRGTRKVQKGKADMVQSAMKKRQVAQMVNDYLKATEKAIRANSGEVDSWYKEDRNGTPTVTPLGPNDFKKEERTITGLDLLMGANIKNPLPLIKIPIERDYRINEQRGNDRNHLELLINMIKEHNAPFWECGGFADFGLGPVWDILTFGGNELAGSHARAEASIASLSQCKDMTQIDVNHVNLSCPETVHPNLIKDSEVFYSPYMQKAIRNGLEDKGTFTKTFNESYMSLSVEERTEILKSHSSWDRDQAFEVDGEIWCSPSIFNRLNLSLCSSAQFRAIPRLKASEVDRIIQIWGLWRKEMLRIKTAKSLNEVKAIIKRSNEMVSYLITKSIEKGLLRTGGYFKGLITPINGLKDNVVLMDINAAKGRDKGAIKSAVKEMITSGVKELGDSMVLGIIQSLGYDVDDAKSIVPVVQPSWQTGFLIQDGDIEASVERHIKLITDGFNDLINDGILHQYFKTILLSNKLIDKDLESEDNNDENLAIEEQDVLDLVVKEHNNLMADGVNLCAHPKITKMIRTNVLKYLRRGKFSMLPLGQTEAHFGENRVGATRSYIATAPELPMDGFIVINGKRIKATVMYHPDTRWANKVGLLWRYPIMKNTTIMPCIFLPMPEERKLNGKSPSCAYLNSETTKQFLVGDTDGDQVCFMKYFINGEEDFTYEVTREGFTFSIDRDNGIEDDMDLLGAYASILDDEPKFKLPKLHDPVDYLDNDKDHQKQPLQIDWSEPGQAAFAAHVSKKGIGSVALMYWGITALNTELQQLRLLVEKGKFETIKSGHKATFIREGKVNNIQKVQASLDMAENIVSNLYGWAALQGEASVIGAKYDTIWHAFKAMDGALSGLGNCCNWCNGDKDKRTKPCNKKGTKACNKTCAASGYRNVTETLRCLGDIDQYSALELQKHAGLLDNLGAVYTVLMDRVVEEINIVRKSLSNKVKQHCNGKVFNVITKNVIKDNKQSRQGEDLSWLRENTLHWDVRYDQQRMRLMEKINGSAFIGRNAEQLSETLQRLVKTPSFMNNTFTRMMDVFGPGLEKLHGDMKTKDSKAKTNAKNLRISWGKKFASMDNENKLIPYNQLVNEDEMTEIKVLLKTFDVMSNNRAPRSELIDVNISWASDNDPETKAGEAILQAILETNNYGDLKSLGHLVRWMATGLGTPRLRTYKNTEGTFLPDGFMTKPVKILGIPYQEVFSTLGRKAEVSFVKALVEEFLEKEAKMWKEMQELFYNSFDSWCAHATKAQIEVIWRMGHLDGIMDIEGNVIERQKGMFGNVLVSGTANYISGETLGLKALGTHLNEFISTVKRVLMNNIIFSPVAICVANNEDKPNYEERHPKQGMKVHIKFTEDRRFEVTGPNGENWFIFKKVNHKHLKNLEFVAPEWFTTDSWEEDFIIKAISHKEITKKDGTVNANNLVFACTLKKANKDDLPPIKGPPPQSTWQPQGNTFNHQGPSEYIPHPDEVPQGSNDDPQGLAPEHQFREYDVIIDIPVDDSEYALMANHWSDQD